MSMLTFPYDIHLLQFVGLLLSHRSQEDFVFFFLKKDGRYDLLFPVRLILIIIDHYPPEIETMEMLMLAEINETLMHNRCKLI